MRIVAGIDYSLSCPAMCIHRGQVWNPANCQFVYLYSVKKWLRNDTNLLGSLPPEFDTDTERLDAISEFLITHLKSYQSNIEIYIENYSYTGHSSSTHILAEGCGILKWKLWRDGYVVTPLSVSQIKKFGSGKGNATKLQMFNAFENERSSLHAQLPCDPGKSPLADCIDAYYIAKLGFERGRE